jgi:hypothetical protein
MIAPVTISGVLAGIAYGAEWSSYWIFVGYAFACWTCHLPGHSRIRTLRSRVLDSSKPVLFSALIGALVGFAIHRFIHITSPLLTILIVSFAVVVGYVGSLFAFFGQKAMYLDLLSHIFIPKDQRGRAQEHARCWLRLGEAGISLGHSTRSLLQDIAERATTHLWRRQTKWHFA